MTLEIETTRPIAAQILRHRSFTYQEFSQRYADSSMLSDKIPLPALRRQDEKNRQNSIDDLDPFDVQNLNFRCKLCLTLPCSIQTDARTWRCKGMCSHGTPTLHAHQNHMTGSCVHGFITSLFVLLTEPNRNTWILHLNVKRYLRNNSLSWQSLEW